MLSKGCSDILKFPGIGINPGFWGFNCQFLKILQELLKGFGICPWKASNLEKLLIGEDDLDILVNPKDKLKYIKYLKTKNYSYHIPKKIPWQNEIFHYFGMDYRIQKNDYIYIFTFC